MKKLYFPKPLKEGLKGEFNNETERNIDSSEIEGFRDNIEESYTIVFHLNYSTIMSKYFPNLKSDGFIQISSEALKNIEKAKSMLEEMTLHNLEEADECSIF